MKHDVPGFICAFLGELPYGDWAQRENLRICIFLPIYLYSH